jgi:Na+-transporting NADH:ubiquinone oxidoreductase subunit NqrF
VLAEVKEERKWKWTMSRSRREALFVSAVLENEDDTFTNSWTWHVAVSRRQKRDTECDRTNQEQMWMLRLSRVECNDDELLVAQAQWIAWDWMWSRVSYWFIADASGRR